MHGPIFFTELALEFLVAASRFAPLGPSVGIVNRSIILASMSEILLRSCKVFALNTLLDIYNFFL